MRHPYEDTPQYQMIYGNRHGKPLASPGNGMGRLPREALHDGDEVPFLFTEQGGKVYERDLVAPVESGAELPFSTGDLLLAMEGLTPKQRFVIELRYGIRGTYSQQEVADLMGITQQSVWELESNALGRMRTTLSSLEV